MYYRFYRRLRYTEIAIMTDLVLGKEHAIIIKLMNGRNKRNN